jgi:RuvA N terminal domain
VIASLAGTVAAVEPGAAVLAVGGLGRRVLVPASTAAAPRAVFPDQRCRPAEARGWSSDGLYLRGVPATSEDPSFRATGFGGRIVGSRAALLLPDDPTDQATSPSAVEVQRARLYLDMTVLPRLKPAGSAICITPRGAEEDTAAHLQRQGWRRLRYPAPGGYPWLPAEGRDAEGLGSLWPQQWSLDRLTAERRRRGALPRRWPPHGPGWWRRTPSAVARAR